MPRTLPELAGVIYAELENDARIARVPRKKRSWREAARRLLYIIARGDRSTFKRTPQQKDRIHRELLQWLQPWKGPNAKALKKEFRDLTNPGGGGGGGGDNKKDKA